MDKNTRMKKGLCKSVAVAFVCLLLVISPFAMAEEIASLNNILIQVLMEVTKSSGK